MRKLSFDGQRPHIFHVCGNFVQHRHIFIAKKQNGGCHRPKNQILSWSKIVRPWPTTRMPQQCGQKSSDQLPKKKLALYICKKMIIYIILAIWWPLALDTSWGDGHVHVTEDHATITRDIAQTLWPWPTTKMPTSTLQC